LATDSGSLLVSAGLVGEEQLSHARRAQSQVGGTVGEHLVVAGVVDDETLTEFYAAKLRVPRVSESELSAISAELLRKIPPDMAAEFRILPISHDGEQNLTVAMSDPSDNNAVDEVTFFTGCYVVRAVATQAQIAWGLGHYYRITTSLTAPRRDPVRAVAAADAARAVRAASVREAFDDEETGPGRISALVRRANRKREGNSGELPPRSGEVQAQEPLKRVVERLPAVVVEEEELTAPPPEEPILLDRPRRPSGKPPAEVVSDEEPVTQPERSPGAGMRPGSDDPEDGWQGGRARRRPTSRRRRRTSRQTEPGLGRLGAVDSQAEVVQDTEDLPGLRGARTGEHDPVSPRRHSKKSGRTEASTTPVQEPAAKIPTRAKTPSVDEGWDVDDGWGPPGTTIPPQFIGATPTALEDQQSGSIPLSVGDDVTGEVLTAENAAPIAAPDEDTARVSARAAQAVSTPVAATAAIAAPQAPIDPVQLASELERSSNRLLETVRKLERAGNRDGVIDVLLDHLGGVCQRRAFFAIKSGVVVPFRQQGASRPGVGTGELSLQEPSTFGQVASSRLPYHGMVSPAAAQFVAKALGGAPRGETVALPVLLRGRAVALLYGDGISGRVFDEHLMVLGRAAGQALERIVTSSKQA
jgi:hypothetical protein